MYKSVASVICIYPIAVMIMDVTKPQTLSIPDNTLFPHEAFINQYIGDLKTTITTKP